MFQGLEVRSNTSLRGVTRRCLSSSAFLKLRASSAALRQPPQAQNRLPQLRLCSPSAHKTQPMPGGLRQPLPWPLFCLSCWLIGSVWAICCVSMSPSRTKLAVPRRGTSTVTVSSVRALSVSSGHPSVLRFPSLLLEVVRRLLRNSENLFHIQIERTSA